MTQQILDRAVLRLPRTAGCSTSSSPLPHQNLQRTSQGTGNKRRPTVVAVSPFQLFDLHGLWIAPFLGITLSGAQSGKPSESHPLETSPPDIPSHRAASIVEQRLSFRAYVRKRTFFTRGATSTTKMIGAKQPPSKTRYEPIRSSTNSADCIRRRMAPADPQTSRDARPIQSTFNRQTRGCLSNKPSRYLDDSRGRVSIPLVVLLAVRSCCSLNCPKQYTQQH